MMMKNTFLPVRDFSTVVLGCLLLISCGCDITESGQQGMKVAWLYSYQHAGDPRPVPQIVGNRVIASAGLDLVSLDLESGEEVWRQPATEEHALQSTGIAVGQKHVLTAHIRDYRAFKVSTGAKVWERAFDSSSYLVTRYSTFASTGDLLLSASQDGRVYAWNDADLSLRYRTPPLRGNGVVTAIAVEGTRGFAGLSDRSGDGDHQSKGQVAAFDLATGDTLWSFEAVGGSIFTPLAVHDDVVYASLAGVNSADFALDAATGRVIWRQDDGGAGADWIIEDKTLYGWAGLYGARSLYARDAATGRLKWKADLNQGSAQEVVALGDYVYALDSSGLFVVEAATGKVVHTEYAPDGYWWNIAKADDRIIVQSTGTVVAYRPYRP